MPYDVKQAAGGGGGGTAESACSRSHTRPVTSVSKDMRTELPIAALQVNKHCVLGTARIATALICRSTSPKLVAQGCMRRGQVPAHTRMFQGAIAVEGAEHCSSQCTPTSESWVCWFLAMGSHRERLPSRFMGTSAGNQRYHR